MPRLTFLPPYGRCRRPPAVEEKPAARALPQQREAQCAFVLTPAHGAGSSRTVISEAEQSTPRNVKMRFQIRK